MKKTAGMKLTITGFCSIMAGIVSAEVPADWFDKCFGADNAGSTSYSENGGVLDITVTGAGNDIWAASDTGRFVFKPLAGDCEIIATVPAIPRETAHGEWARQGLMMRGATLNGAEQISLLRNKGNATTGTRVERTVRPTHGSSTTTAWGSQPQTLAYGTNAPARIRLVRQGDTYTAWGSTNAPAYDEWDCFGSHTVVFGRALNVGLVVSRASQPAGAPDLTCAFANVVARNLVTARPDAGGGIAVEWIGDTPVTNGTVTGYTVSRAVVADGAFAPLGSQPAADPCAFTDETAESGVSYVYRVTASVNVDGGGTAETVVGTSMPARHPAVAGNPSPASRNGVYAEYYNAQSGGTLVSARVDPNISNSWLYAGGDVFPANTPNGLSQMRNFRTRYAGNITVPETGCYALADVADDSLHLWVDGARVIAQDVWLSGREQSTTPVWLEAGRSYPIRLDHFESDSDGGEWAILRWAALGTAATATIPQSAFEPFPWPWQHRDTGESPRFGNAVFDPAAQSFAVSSGGLGVDTATGRDDSHLVWQESAEDVDLIARVADLQGPAQAGFGAGVMAKGTGNDAVLALSVLAGGVAGTDRAIRVTYRESGSGGAVFEEWPLADASPVELRLSRQGTNILAFYRTAGSGGWVGTTGMVVQSAAAFRLGMAAFSGDTSMTATGVFDRVTFAYPNRTFSATAVNGQATLVAPGISPMEERQDTATRPNIAYYWADDQNGDVNAYTVYRSDRQDGVFESIGQATRANNFTFTDPIADPNTLVFYRMEGVYDLGGMAGGGAGGYPFLTGVYGVSDGSVTGTGAGLYAAFHRGGASGYFYTTQPVHAMIRDLGAWEKGTANTPIVTAAASDDSVAIGPDNFQATWTGWLIPQYTGFHQFRTQVDDVNMLWINGKRVILQDTYNAAARDSAAVWLEAGKRVPIHVYFQQGTGGGYFRMWWKHGLGFDAGFVTIPATQLVSPFPGDAPAAVAPDTVHAFGPWKNIDVGAVGCPGHAVLGGSPEAFDCTITGSGADIWGNADAMHFVYREVKENFEMEATFNSILVPADGWTKVGLMVRDGVAPGARNVFLCTTISNTYKTQARTSTDGTSINSDPTAATHVPQIVVTNVMGAATPVTFKLARRKGKIEMYIDGQRITGGGADQDISGWAQPLCVGLALTSHQNSRNTASFVSDVTFTINHPKGTVLQLK